VAREEDEKESMNQKDALVELLSAAHSLLRESTETVEGWLIHPDDWGQLLKFLKPHPLFAPLIRLFGRRVVVSKLGRTGWAQPLPAELFDGSYTEPTDRENTVCGHGDDLRDGSAPTHGANEPNQKQPT
jgi:hypothetical protein